MISLTSTESDKSYELCKGKSPYQCEVEAEQCGANGAHVMAAVWYQAAAHASIGRTRTAMYEAAAKAELRKAGRH